MDFKINCHVVSYQDDLLLSNQATAARKHRKGNGMCNTTIRFASVLVLVVSGGVAHAASATNTAGRFSTDRRTSRKKKRMHRCESHVKNFCTWIHGCVITKTWSITRKSARLAERPIASHAISSRLKRYLNAGTAAVLSAHCHMEDAIETIVHFVSTPVMSMIVNRETE
jgi:hypothetical protein